MENVRGAILMSIAMAGFAIEDMFIKLTKDFGMPTGQVLAILGLMGGMVYWGFMARKGIPLITRKLTDRGVMIRNLGEFVGTGCYVLAFTGGALSSASAVMQALPLFVTMGAAIFLGQQVGWRRWTAIGVGFVGVLMVIQPWGEYFNPYLVLAFIGVLGMAGRDVQTRALHGEIHSLQIAAWGFFTIVPLGLIIMAVQSTPAIVPTSTQWLLLIGATAIGTGAYYLLIMASRLGDMAVIAPFRYTRIVFALIVGLVVFDEWDQINTMLILGIIIIITSGIYTFYRQYVARHASL